MDFGDLQSFVNTEFEHISKQYHGVVVSCSGGVDSTALFHLICQITNEKKYFSRALFHVNFGLRGKNSDEDERFCEAMAKAAGVEFHLRRIDPQVPENRSGMGVQEWARGVRQEEFAKYIEKNWVVAVAHHLDDVAENVLLRAARGTGPGTMAGMRRLHNGIWRPFLEIPKSRLLHLAAENRMNHRHDASNDKLEYSRNVIRNKVLPELEKISPGSAQRIARLGLECQEITDSVRANSLVRLPLEDLSQENLRRFRTWIPAAQLLDAPGIKEWVTQVARDVAQGNPIGLSRDFLDEFLIVLKDPPRLNSWAREIAGGIRVRMTNGFLYVEEVPMKDVTEQQS